MHHRKGRGWKNNNNKTKSFLPLYLLLKSLIKGKKDVQNSDNIMLLFSAVDLVMRVNSSLLNKALKQT